MRVPLTCRGISDLVTGSRSHHGTQLLLAAAAEADGHGLQHGVGRIEDGCKHMMLDAGRHSKFTRRIGRGHNLGPLTEITGITPSMTHRYANSAHRPSGIKQNAREGLGQPNTVGMRITSGENREATDREQVMRFEFHRI